MNSERLKIAIQKSGRLADESQKLLQNCGIKLTKSKDQLYCTSLNFPLDIYFIRDDDIPSFVASKVCQIGIVGRNVIKEEQILKKNKSIKNVSLISSLEFGKCRLVIAVPHEFKYEGIKSLKGKVIAIGDLHGDWNATVNTLIKAGVIKKNRVAPNIDPVILEVIFLIKNLLIKPIKITLPQVNKLTL